MAIHHVTPRPSQPQPFPKPPLYEAISTLNRDLGTVIEDFNRLRQFRFSRLYIDAFIIKIEDLRAWANAEFLEQQLDREMKDWYHFGRIDRKFEKRFLDPNDVLIEAEHRRAELAAEEQDVLAKASRIRKQRSAAKRRTAAKSRAT